jgi:hypothetical protein
MGDPECQKTERGEPGIPALIRFQLWHGPHAGETTTERGEIERLARACQAAGCKACLDRTVVETRFNVVRSSVPDTVATARRLGDYLPPVDQGDSTVRGEKSLDEAAMTIGA